MKCQSLFSAKTKNKKIIISLSSADYAWKAVKFKVLIAFLSYFTTETIQQLPVFSERCLF